MSGRLYAADGGEAVRFGVKVRIALQAPPFEPAIGVPVDR